MTLDVLFATSAACGGLLCWDGKEHAMYSPFRLTNTGTSPPMFSPYLRIHLTYSWAWADYAGINLGHHGIRHNLA
jgi:hypothetical protein